MIVKTAFRQSEGIEIHLLRSDTNEQVIVRRDLFRGPPGLHQSLRLMDGISRTNPKTKRSYVHVVISPSLKLDDVRLATALGLIETEFGIRLDSPRAVVQHTKGDRPDHYHAVYSIVELATGKAIDSHQNYQKDELISRLLEIQFGEKIVAGPRLGENIAELRRRGANQQADILEAYALEPQPDSLSRTERQQGTRLGVDPSALSAEVYSRFEDAGRDLLRFRDLLREGAYGICRGSKAILVTKDENGFQMPLVRTLRREAKAAGSPISLRESDLVRTFEDLAPFEQERDAGLKRANIRANKALEVEWQRAVFEATADGDEVELERYRLQRKKCQRAEEQSDRDAFNVTLKARRNEILHAHKQRDDILRARVDRAFRAARLLDTPALRRLAFALASIGVLMTGASLPMALAGSCLALGALPSMSRARRLATRLRHERVNARVTRDQALQETYGRTKRELRKPKVHIRFTFDTVPKPDRILAGAYVISLLRPDGSPNGPDTIAGIEKALGASTILGLRQILETGSEKQIQLIKNWYNSVDEAKRKDAIVAALRRHQQDKLENTSALPSGGHRRRPQRKAAESTRRKEAVTKVQKPRTKVRTRRRKDRKGVGFE